MIPFLHQPIRIGRRPAKSLFLIWAKGDLRRLKPSGTALDLACGTMFFRSYLPAEHYIGVDVLQERLDRGRQRHPDARAICGKIEDLPPDIAADIVICFETIGINSWFDASATMRCIDKLIGATRTGGTALVNLGPYAANWHEPALNRLRESFASVDVKPYGRWNFQTHFTISFALATLMRIFPGLRTAKKTPWLYVKCGQKR
jgi:SAM-dependent methyltransferase